MEELKMTYPGDIRETGGREVIFSPQHGALRPIMAEYDEAANRTSITYEPVPQGTQVQPDEQGFSLMLEYLNRQQARDAAWARFPGGGVLR